jgi:serine/threonine protein kinase
MQLKSVYRTRQLARNESMKVCCPHCHSPVEEILREGHDEIICPSCGSSFNLDRGSTTADLPRGGKFGKFQLLQIVGQGAFGSVYKAIDPDLDRVVAVKLPRTGSLSAGPDFDRFLREARSVAQLRHPGVVAVYEAGQSEGMPYLVSEFVQGITLADLLTDRPPPAREAARIVAAVADALQYAHDQGVIHRDVSRRTSCLTTRASPV